MRNIRKSREKLMGVVFGVVSIASVMIPTTGGYAEISATQPAVNEYAEGEVLVRFKDRASPEMAVRALNALAAQSVKSYDRIGVQRLKLPEGTGVEEAVALLNEDENVEYAEPNYVYKSCDTFPNDPMFDELWGLHNTGQTGGTPDADIDAPAAWDISTGSSDVVVAVIDTGVDYTHPDLAANMWTNDVELNGDEGVDDDENGYIDDIYGIDTCTHDGHVPDSDPLDDAGHGTHCAGTIGAVGDNGTGVVGVNWNVRIMALKFLDAWGWGHTSDAVEALNYVIDMKQSHGVNVKVTSNSWGGGPYSQSLYDAIEEAGAAGILFVAAAGNEGRDSDLYPHYPSSYDPENIIAVAATDHNDALASFSNYGLTSVDLGVPGVCIYSTMPTYYAGMNGRTNSCTGEPFANDYDYMSGTSMATPHVAGMAALRLAENPDYLHYMLKRTILESVDPVGGLAGITVTGGRLNAYRALVETPAPASDIRVDPARFDLILPFDTTETHSFTIRNRGNAALTYEMARCYPHEYEDDECPWLDPQPASGSVPPFDEVEIALTIDTTGLEIGEYYGGDIIIESNDPDEPTTEVTVIVKVVTAGIVYVDGEATGDNDGSSWMNAFTDLQDALDITGRGAQIWVAEGAYKPTVLAGSGPRTASFQLVNEVAVYGGFDPSVGDTQFEDRDWETNVTILSGDIGEVGDDSDNSYHVFYHPSGTNLDSTAVLDGFTIAGGNANGGYPQYLGGGMYNEGYSSPTVTNCTFTDNSADFGGGMSNNYSSPTVMNCTFTDNSAGYGGGMYNWRSSPMLTNCAFSDHSSDSGAGIFNSDSSPTLTNCAFSGNTATHGGGIYNDYYSSPTMVNCTFWENSVNGKGGGIYNFEGSSPTLTNCTFTGNAAGAGGGIFSIAGSSPSLTNSILWSNTPNEIYGDAAATHCNIEGGYPGEGNIDADPLFADPDNGDLHLKQASPCINAGDTSAVYPPHTDFEGDDRIINCTVDIGADERDEDAPSRVWVDDDWASANPGDPVGMHTFGCDAFATIQDGIDVVPSPGVVNTADGIYRGTGNKDLDFGGKSITVRSENGPASTIIDCENSGRGFLFHSGEDSTAVVDGFTITNGDTCDGGGISCRNNSSPTIANCIFLTNHANDDGGGMYNEGSSPDVTNCVFTGNTAGDDGGGMYNRYSSPTVTNCTFSENDGYGMYNTLLSSPEVTNSILWGNTSGAIRNRYWSWPVVTYCDVEGGYPGEGNIDEDPRFADAANGDVHLQIDSPCIDAGDNEAVAGVDYDFDGDPRRIEIPSVPDTGNGTPPIVDMGADEEGRGLAFLPIYVRAGAAGANDGSSWADAYTDLQDALNDSNASNGIWVAAGTYKPTALADPDPRTATFQLKSGVALYGGFPNTGNPTWDDRDWESNETVLSCDIGEVDDDSDNCYHVFYHPSGTNLDGTAVLDGFTIAGGNANGEGSDRFGGGMYNDESSPTLTNCSFTYNTAEYGGGMFNTDYSSPTLTDCAFSENSARSETGMGAGGGMYNSESSPTLTNCTFSDNSTHSGGGIANINSSPTLTNCAFSGNSATGVRGTPRGGGMHNDYFSSPTLINCSFWENSASGAAGGEGGGMYNWDSSSPTLINCSFTGNTADTGGGIFSLFGSLPSLTNCILWGDTPEEVYGDADATHCDIEGGYAGEGNIDAEPLFADPDGGDLHLQPGSPCIDAGDNGAVAGIDHDFEGDSRRIDDPATPDTGNGTPPIVDMGVDEYRP